LKYIFPHTNLELQLGVVVKKKSMALGAP
jgi:hypothetical protein